jgi:hypothetical protein
VNRKVINKFGCLQDDHLPINQKQKGIRIWGEVLFLFTTIQFPLVPKFTRSEGLTGQAHSYGGFIKGILRGVRCTKSLRVLYLHRCPPPGPLLDCTQEQYSSLMNPPLIRISSELMLTAVLQVYTILPFSVNQYKLATVQLDSRPRQTWHGRAGGQPNRLLKIL